MKKITFLSNSLSDLRNFPRSAMREAMREAGYQLDGIQRGLEPSDWKPMKTIGRGVREIRIHEDGQYRIIYVANFEFAIYVLHAFQKKTQKTNKRDLDLAKRTYKLIPEIKL